MERYGSRLVCLRHSGVSVPDAVAAVTALAQARAPPPPTPERISVELSDSGAREIDEDEWTDRNFLASETSCAGGLRSVLHTKRTIVLHNLQSRSKNVNT